MFQKKSIIVFLFAVLAVFCFVVIANAAKGGGGCKDRDGDGFFQKAGCGTDVDCDDSNAAVNPNAVEVCDGIDNNCDSTVDEGCGGCTDNDGDGYGNGPDCLGPDCDDNDASINPGASEVCGNGIDEDCDGFDDICPGCTDNDGDGYGEGADCLGPDCDDNDAAVNPGASEVCDDNIDNNCDGTVDENCGGCVPTAAKEKGCDCFDNTDNDCDGSTDSLDRDCRKQTCDTCFDNDYDGWYDCGGDCDDTDPAINPGAPEICNGIDDNCDNTLPVEELDIDADGVSICEGDCDDYNPNRSPNNPEEPFGHPVCTDGIDNDCDDLIDASDPGCDIPCIDNDNDGFGVNGDPSCQYPGIVDCDDTDPTINPLGIDLCDGIDRDCDGQTINDNDADGFGVPASPYCTYNIEDCDDTDPTINPLGIDLCDGIDRDCDGQTINDNDNDGFGVPASPYCTYNFEDCDDTDPTINPFGIDLCDGVDRDCDGQTINDSDNDGFGVPASPYCTYNFEDCDDTDPTINPFGIDLCDGIDRDCDGQTINDNDTDGFGVPASPYCTYNIEDCDDTDPFVNPFGFEGPSGDPTCSDTKDNDCDGSTDSADPDCASPFCSDNTDCSSGTDYCEKAVGNCGGQGSCQPRPGTCTTLWAPVCGCDGITYSNDCGAAMAGVNVDYDGECNSCGAPPGDDSNCNGIDEDCDGVPDDDYVPSPTTCGDGECATTGLLECQAGGLVDTCVPLPLQQEGPDGDPTCMDGLDNDCDNTTDGADNDCAPTICDPDGDGYCDCPECISGDCDDYDPNVYPGAPPICDGKDSNCDGQLDFPTDVDMDDDGVPLCAGDCDDTGPACCDNDGDGYGKLGGTDMCSGGLDVDCNDNNPNVNPGAAEGPIGAPTCTDALDNDCDGLADIDDPDCFSWSIEAINSAGWVAHPSMTTDSLNNVHVAYMATENIDLNYMTNASGSWVIEIVDDMAISSGGQSDIAVDDWGNIHISYCDGNHRDKIKYATNVSGTWVVEIIDDMAIPGCDNSIAVDSSGYVHISYRDYINTTLKYATNSSGTMVTEILDSTGGGSSSIALDAQDNVHISYTNGDLLYLTNKSGTWITETADIFGVYSSIAVDSLGKVHISYVNTQNVIKYASNSSGAWIAENVDTGVDHYFTYHNTSIAVDSLQGAHISYRDGLNLDLKYATNLSGSWSTFAVDTVGDVGVYPSISVDSLDIVHLTYSDYPNALLKYATNNPQDVDNDNDGYTEIQGDCHDGNPALNPGANEGPLGDPTCLDGLDNDCDGFIDSDQLDCADLADAPHDMIYDCMNCHVGSSYMDPIPNQKCEQCHTPGGNLKSMYPTAPDVQTHKSNWYADPTTGLLVDIMCIECHNPMRAQSNLSHIRDNIRGVPIVFPPFDDICSACHTQTLYYLRDGTGLPHNDGVPCNACHTHIDGYSVSF